MYFETFPLIYHGVELNGQEVIVKLRDITRNVRVRREILANITLYDYYDIRAGETAESIAEKFYGNAQYHWVVMLLNEKYDYVTDWPLVDVDLQNYCTAKYGKGNEYKTHHFVDNKGFIVNSTNPRAVAISNFQFEDELNEKKRRIKLIAPSLLSLVMSDFESLMAT